MNAQQPGFWAGAALGGAGVGAIAGLIPLFFGVKKGKTRLAVGGFLGSTAGGLVGGAVGALPLAGIFVYLIRPWEGRGTKGIELQGRPRGESSLGWYLVVMFVGQTLFLAVFWSFFMSIWMGSTFMKILVPSGAGFGLTMGVFMTVVLAILFRPETVRLRVFDRADFLARMDRGRPAELALGVTAGSE